MYGEYFNEESGYWQRGKRAVYHWRQLISNLSETIMEPKLQTDCWYSDTKTPFDTFRNANVAGI